MAIAKLPLTPNGAYSSLSSGIDDSQTNIAIDAAGAFADPADTDEQYICVIWDDTAFAFFAEDPDHEFVLATDLTGTTITGTRGQLGTDPAAHAAGQRIEAVPSSHIFGIIQTQLQRRGRHLLIGWLEENIASDTVVTMQYSGTAFTRRAVMRRPGSLTGISVFSNTARTAGTLTAEVLKNGSGTGLTAVIDGTNTTFDTTDQNPGLDTHVAGDRYTIQLTTVGFTPNATAEIECTLEITDD